MIKSVIRTLILAVLITLLIILAVLFWPRFIYQEGITQLTLKQYDKAIHYFDRAEKKIPEFLATTFARADMYRIYTNYGQALYHKGIQDWKKNGPSIKTYTLLRKGKLYLTNADTISAITYRNSYWLTLTEEALEKLHQELFPKLKNPYNAYVFYKKTLPLRPAGSAIRYAYLRYLNFKKQDSEILPAVENLMAIYPPAFYQLKKESFYSENLIPYVEKGLIRALEHDTLPGTAAKALSDLHEQAKDYSKAVSYFHRYLQLEPSSNTAYNYIHLGRLYLKQGKDQHGLETFEKSLMLPGNASTTLNRIYRTFKAEKKEPDFFSFLTRARHNGIQIHGQDMTLARIHMDMKQYDQAKENLSRIIASEPDARAYAMLADIARKQKDWDQMELLAQQAVRLDQDNPAYYYTLAQSLWVQKKYERAEEEITSAIEVATKENPRYFHFRARARWAQKEYAPAVSDWEKAFDLKPDRADFAYRVALGCEKLGRFEKALAYIQKAGSLAPDNKKYKALRKRLESYQH